ncbi:MAG: hypothetical protein GY845_17475 [Planctomycetes bacterium]|nr:hypothetical protein [Planctomycetota bacterium]
MFNAEDLLIQIGDRIADELLSGRSKLHICLFENIVTARPKNHTRKDHPIACSISEREARCGLTPSKWNELRDKAWALHKTIQVEEIEIDG